MWEKEKLLVMSNFSFSHNIFKHCLLLMHQNEYLWGKGLISQTLILVIVFGQSKSVSNSKVWFGFIWLKIYFLLRYYCVSIHGSTPHNMKYRETHCEKLQLTAFYCICFGQVSVESLYVLINPFPPNKC